MSQIATTTGILSDEWKSKAQSALDRIYETLDRNKKALEESILLRKRVENIHYENRTIPSSPTNPFFDKDIIPYSKEPSSAENTFFIPDFQSPHQFTDELAPYHKYRKSPQKQFISPTSVLSEDKYQEIYEKYKNEEYLKLQYENHAWELKDRVRELELKVSMIRREVQRNQTPSPHKEQIVDVQRHLETEQKQIKELEDLLAEKTPGLEDSDSSFCYSKMGEFENGKYREPKLKLDKISEDKYYESYRGPPLNKEDLVKTTENDKMKNILEPIKAKLQALETNYRQKLQYLGEQLIRKNEENTELKEKLKAYESNQESFNSRLTQLLHKINEQKDQNDQLKDSLKLIYDKSERSCSCSNKDAVIQKMQSELESYLEKVKDLEYMVNQKRYTELANYISTTENTESTCRTKPRSLKYRSESPLKDVNYIPSTDISVLVSKKKNKIKKKSVKPKKTKMLSNRENKENKENTSARRRSSHK